MSLSNKQWEFLQDVARLIGFAKSIHVKLTGGELNRTDSQQLLNFYGKELRFDNGEVKVIEGRKVSNTMNSDHLKRLAIDFNFFIDGALVYDNKNEKLIMLGEFWEALNPLNYWGGFFKTFNDSPHFGRKER